MPQKKQSAESSSSPVMQRMELLIGWVLLSGVVISMGTVLVGLLLMFAHHPEYLRSADDFQRLTARGATFPATPREVAQGVLAGRGQAVVVLGLLLLIATPILRVALSIVGFALQRDHTYAVISAVVLLLLLISFVLGRVE